MQKLLSSLAIVALLTSAPVMAQTSDPTAVTPATSFSTPRVSEINKRVESQETKINNDVKEGKISASQAVRDEKTDAKVEKQLSADEAKHNGHITKAEQTRLNSELTKNSKRIHHQVKADAKSKLVAPVTQ